MGKMHDFEMQLIVYRNVETNVHGACYVYMRREALLARREATQAESRLTGLMETKYLK
jgi:hypothetical protein